MRLSALGLWLLAGAAFAAPVTFGNRTLEVPLPEGFVPSAAEVPQFLEISQGYLPAGNRLVEIYISPDDLAAFQEAREPDLSRYLQLQVARSMEGRAISPAGFEDARALMEAELEQALAKVDETAPDLARKGNDQLEEMTGSDAKLSFGGVRYLGAFRREPWGLFFSIESDVSVSGSDASAEDSGKVICAGALVIVNHQVLYLYAFANDGDGARDWAEGAVGAWADAVRAANPDDPEVAKTAVDLDGRGALFEYGGMAAGALVGVVLAVLLTSLRRKKTP